MHQLESRNCCLLDHWDARVHSPLNFGVSRTIVNNSRTHQNKNMKQSTISIIVVALIRISLPSLFLLHTHTFTHVYGFPRLYIECVYVINVIIIAALVWRWFRSFFFLHSGQNIIISVCRCKCKDGNRTRRANSHCQRRPNKFRPKKKTNDNLKNISNYYYFTAVFGWMLLVDSFVFLVCVIIMMLTHKHTHPAIRTITKWSLCCCDEIEQLNWIVCARLWSIFLFYYNFCALNVW